jgi:hypothetical protein
MHNRGEIQIHIEIILSHNYVVHRDESDSRWSTQIVELELGPSMHDLVFVPWGSKSTFLTLEWNRRSTWATPVCSWSAIHPYLTFSVQYILVVSRPYMFLGLNCQYTHVCGTRNDWYEDVMRFGERAREAVIGLTIYLARNTTKRQRSLMTNRPPNHSD